MGILRDTSANGLGRHGAPVDHARQAPPPSADWPAGPHVDGRSDLLRRREELQQQVAELHWDLGGLTYEMAIRDHFRLDVLVRRATLLQERDTELAEVEALLRSSAVGAGTTAEPPRVIDGGRLPGPEA